MGSEKETPRLIGCGVVPQSTETKIAEETMVIGNRLRELREAKRVVAGDIEKRTGLLRCYIPRVENNHTVPAVDTLETLARALEIPMYQLFHVGAASSDVQNRKLEDDDDWGVTGRDRAYLSQLAKSLSQMTRKDRNLLFRSCTENFQA
jgi:transcriptional regulator with XRE-family HTH domain